MNTLPHLVWLVKQTKSFVEKYQIDLIFINTFLLILYIFN